MKKNIRWFVILTVVLFILQLINSILYCIIGNSICATMSGFASGVAFMGAIVMYNQYKNCKE